jgi:hypothetical protein
MRSCRDAIRLKPKPKDALVRLKVGKIKQQGTRRSRALRVTHEPTKTSPGYSAIRGLPIRHDGELCALLANLAVVEVTEIRAL